jgi:hypothetical protein
MVVNDYRQSACNVYTRDNKRTMSFAAQMQREEMTFKVCKFQVLTGVYEAERFGNAQNYDYLHSSNIGAFNFLPKTRSLIKSIGSSLFTFSFYSMKFIYFN